MNQDLQATHQILSLLENSKSLTDRVFDQLPGIFVCVDVQGKILRANHEIAKLVKIDPELLLGFPLSKLFKEETWQQFLGKLRQIDASETEVVEFELPIDGLEGSPRSFIWQIFSFEFGIKLNRKLYSCIGRDISDLKKALSDVYSLAKDLEVTGAVQTLLLPKENVFQHKNCKLAAFYQAATQSGGDWWNYSIRPNGSMVLMLGDVTGHGAGSAMVTALMAGCYKSLSENHNVEKQVHNIPVLLEEMNYTLKDFCENKYWMTMSALEVNPEQNEIKWFTAAAPPIFVLRPNGDIETVVSSGSPIGSKSITIGSDSREVAKGDRVLIFTDGAYEFWIAIDRQFGLKRLRSLFLQTKDMNLEQAREHLASQIKGAMIQGLDPSLYDDTTFIVVDFL